MASLIPIADVATLEEGVPRLVVHDGVPYCVLKTNGETHAFVAACSHKRRGLVPLRVKKGELVCPHHGATFDAVTGEVARARGNDVPTGLLPVELVEREGGGAALRGRRRHRKLLSKKERKRVTRSARVDRPEKS